MDADKTKQLVFDAWDNSVIPALSDFIEIPAESPQFDPDWEKNGYLDQAVDQVSGWIEAQNVAGLKMEKIKIPGRTPVLFIEIEGSIPNTILFYGHLDKQPPVTGWDEGLGPWKPVLREGKLYGRGGADDGYAIFLAITAIKALQDQGSPHARCVCVVECCEESGSFDLPAYLEKLRDRIGTPDLVVCPDSGAGNYDQLWITSSLRGMVGVDLNISMLTEGVHSGDASGVVPSTFRILRQLLDRVEDSKTGRVLPDWLSVDIPAERVEQTRRTAEVLGTIHDKYPFLDGTQPVEGDRTELLLNRTWRPQLEITGAEGLPQLDSAGNVLRAHTKVRLSFRLPPTVDPDLAAKKLEQLLAADPPYNAKIDVEAEGASGWASPDMESWFSDSVEQASENYFGKPVCFIGEGGSIPLMAMLADWFPKAQFLICGVLGPGSNAHGPNEFLEVNMAKRLTCSVAQVVDAHYRANS